ncbi:MAG: amidohydrolase, partial [Candidatus Hodarchaeota archaeon]
MTTADLILINGHIITMNSEQPCAEAIAVHKGHITNVGTNEQILTLKDKETIMLDLGGKTVLPGFIDTHVHGASLGKLLSQIDLRNVQSILKIQQKLKNWVEKRPKGEWIIGRGWSQDQLKEHRYPNRFDLDAVAPNNPVFLLRVCGHLGVVNSKAMKLAGITTQSKIPEGGWIDKDKETGEPNGILRDNALRIVYKVLPELSQEALSEACLLACKRMVKEGITTVHWIMNSRYELHILQRLRDAGKLPLRIYVMIPIDYLDHLVGLGLSTGFGCCRLKIGSVKILADGSLGARTAALKEAYKDAPERRGMLLHSEEQLKSLIEKAHHEEMQLAIHAIGDMTIEVTLRILDEVLRRMPRENHRHRIEHVSVLNQRLLKKIKSLSLIASVQPHFAISDFWVGERLGERRSKWTYAFKSLISEGILTVGGSDSPVEPV